MALPQVKSSKQKLICRKLGFLVYPEFMDNYFVHSGDKRLAHFLCELRKNVLKVRFAILPDYKYNLMERLVNWNPRINWIFPLHRKSELRYVEKLNVKWIGFPHRRKWRDYTLNWFLQLPYRKWYMGFWNESQPQVLLTFDGFDTTIPIYTVFRKGRIWIDWNTYQKADIPADMKLEISLRNFRRAVNEILVVTRLD